MTETKRTTKSNEWNSGTKHPWRVRGRYS